MRRASEKIIVLAIACALVAQADTAAAAPSPAGQTLALVNQARAAHGLAPLAARADLAAYALRHARHMAAERAIWHAPDLRGVFPAPAAVGDNVGAGPTIGNLHRAYMDSPSHRANVLRPVFRFAGVGVVVGEDGLLYHAVVFASTGRSAPPPPRAVQRAPGPVRTVAVLLALRDMER